MVGKSDKFILINMDDERSKKVAEVLGNKTCKKILDYLTDNSNKSEEDISKNLKIPINTVEYNLKKLLKTGLIEKSKKFFWSKRGKKIDLYNPAKKHIIISPRNSKINTNSLNLILPIIAIATIVIVAALILFINPNSNINYENEFKTFESIKDMKNFIGKNSRSSGGFEQMFEGKLMATESTSGTSFDSGKSQTATDYSTTNIQVEGVDEADIIKNDGKYIYVVSGNKVVIVNAYPAEDMEILSEINSLEGHVEEIFINDDKLIVFSNDYRHPPYIQENCHAIGCVVPQDYQEQRSLIYIYDILDKENPELENEISVTGNYFDSRMIENYIYVIANQYVYEEPVLPSITKDNNTEIIEPCEIYYQDIQDRSFQYTIVLAINLDDASTNEKVMLTGSTQNIYVSKKNIYTTFTEYPQWIADEINLDEEKTLINKISIDDLNIEFVASGEVLGHILNQFSMDEFDNNFRIAITIGEVWNEENPSENNLYVLDEDLELIGKLEGLAPGESIYSVRFMGERGYVVTFKKIDPLFVIDLSNPKNPNVLGKLKIPGYSDYLHAYDENHIIGIGKETIETKKEINGTNNFVWQQGVKIAIFDVSDVENPIELHKVVIGDQGTDSEVLRDHKAFLFDKEKELIVLPITLYELEENSPENSYGDYTFQGTYVYNVNLEDGFEFKGRISHYDEGEVEDKSGYYWNGNKNILRSLYMNDTLYTFSNEILKANELEGLDEISFVELGYEEEKYYGKIGG